MMKEKKRTPIASRFLSLLLALAMMSGMLLTGCDYSLKASDTDGTIDAAAMQEQEGISVSEQEVEISAQENADVAEEPVISDEVTVVPEEDGEAAPEQENGDAVSDAEPETSEEAADDDGLEDITGDDPIGFYEAGEELKAASTNYYGYGYYDDDGPQSYVKVVKTWNVAEGDNIKIPTSAAITVSLGRYNDTVVTVTSDSDWTGMKRVNSQRYDHYLSDGFTITEGSYQYDSSAEGTVPGTWFASYTYETSTTDDGSRLLTIYVTNTPSKKVDITVEKVWEGLDEGDSYTAYCELYGVTADYRSYSLKTFKFTSGGTCEQTVTVDNYVNAYGDNCAFVRYYVDEYRVTEGSSYYPNVRSYFDRTIVSDGNTFTVTNTKHDKDAKTSITIKKEWKDFDPGEEYYAVFQIYADGKAYGDPVTLNAANGWTCTVDVPKYNETTLTEIYYRTEEIGVYTVSDPDTNLRSKFGIRGNRTGDAENPDAFTDNYINVNTEATRDITVRKTWCAPLTGDGYYVVCQLQQKYSDYGEPFVLSAENGWEQTFEDLAKYDRYGYDITYSVEEIGVYEVSDTGRTNNLVDSYYPETWWDGDTLILRNNAPVQITVNKSWVGVDADLMYMALCHIVGYNASGEQLTDISVPAYQSDGWTNTYTMPKYGSDGLPITYQFEYENNVLGRVYNKVYNYWSVTSEGFDGAFDPTCETVHDGDNYTFNVTNTLKSQATTTVSGTKTWDDHDNDDGIRPDSVTVDLYKTVGTEQVLVDSQEVTRDTDWTYSFTDLKKYDNDLNLIEYTVEEEPVDGYTTAIDGYDITNTHTPETTSITVTKTWDDNGNNDRVRPDSVTFSILANGEDTGKTVTLSGDTDTWTATVEGLQKNSGGKAITYTVTETDIPDGYTASADGLTVTNTHENDTTSITVTKIWNDNSDNDGLRPDSVTFSILADGVDTGKTVTLSGDSDTWTAAVDGLTKNADGKAITYTVTETDVPDGYTAAADGLTVTNTHTPETTSVTVTKVWDDNDNADGKRPASVIFTLSDGSSITLDGTPDDDGESAAWTATWTDLPKYSAGAEIAYTVTETSTDPNYKVSYGEGKTSAVSGGTITNIHELVSITVNKVWNDADYLNEPGYSRAAELTLILTGTADGQAVETRSCTLSAGSDGIWQDSELTYTFTDLPAKYNGQEISWTVNEAADPDYLYEVAVSGNTVTNTPVFGENVAYVTLTIHKVDAETGAALTGAQFTIYTDAACTHSLGTVTNGYTFTRAGTYYIRETQAPKGYFKSSRIYTVTVAQDGTYTAARYGDGIWHRVYSLVIGNGNSITVNDYKNTVEITDDSTPLGANPKTADVSNSVLWVETAGFAAATLITLAYLAKKRRRQ